ncbi:guanine nucleotide exchange factor synembryn protein [Mucor ambiguus]|uniref:Guanine nucleotide exchange factor synembryn protein n=1 Tax=Mucor ambiguus TaxID=91626 RepID=A0A0C9M3W3_9FUNG|nr:guanine nucleotide exchange factor synembryn protein [Mucor ambiguus]
MVLDEYKALDQQSSGLWLQFLTRLEEQPTCKSHKVHCSNDTHLPLCSSFFYGREELVFTITFERFAEQQRDMDRRVENRSIIGYPSSRQRSSWIRSTGIRVLVQLAGLHKTTKAIDTTSSQEALKCICNCIFLKESVKPYLEEEHVVDSCLYVLQSEDQRLGLETQFLTCRILFFMTVHRSDLVASLIKSNVADAIAKVLSSNLAILEDPVLRIQIDRNAAINPLTVTSEALKLLFNLMLVEARSDNAMDTNQAFKECLVPILRLLFHVPFAEPQPLVPPHAQAIHALMQFQYTTIRQVWSEQSQWTQHLYNAKNDEHGYKYMANTLVDVLDKSIHVLIPSGDPDHDGNQSADATIAPFLLVLVSLAEGDEAFKQAMINQMLPKEKDRLKPVNEGSGLPAYLIRLMTSTMMPQTRDAACETLFVLCDKDASKFTQQVGYGNAVGFLVNKGIAMEPPQGSTEAEEDVNPITGQYVKEEKLPDLKDMTDEEKEREAERLFVLFERLKKTGIIDVENPIAKAMQESQGRFEEIQSDSDSD